MFHFFKLWRHAKERVALNGTVSIACGTDSTANILTIITTATAKGERIAK